MCGGTEEDEREDLLRTIRMLVDNGCISDLNQVACLFRSVKSDEAADLGRYLKANGIPVYSPRSDMFFERQEVRQTFMSVCRTRMPASSAICAISVRVINVKEGAIWLYA